MRCSYPCHKPEAHVRELEQIADGKRKGMIQNAWQNKFKSLLPPYTSTQKVPKCASYTENSEFSAVWTQTAFRSCTEMRSTKLRSNF